MKDLDYDIKDIRDHKKKLEKNKKKQRDDRLSFSEVPGIAVAAEAAGFAEPAPEMPAQAVGPVETAEAAAVEIPEKQHASPFAQAFASVRAAEPETTALALTGMPPFYMGPKPALIVLPEARPRLEAASPALPEVIYLSGDVFLPRSRFEQLLDRFFTPRFAAVAILALLLLLPLFALNMFGNFCYLVDAGNPEMPAKVIWSAESSPREIVENIIELHEVDEVEVETFGSTQMLTVVRSYPVTVTVDGSTETLHVLGHTVEELLDTAGIELDSDDLLSHRPNEVLAEGEEVVVRRVSYENRVAVEDVPYETIRRASPMLGAETEYVTRSGADGSAERLYRDCYIDGEYDSSVIVEETVLEEPVAEIILTGDPTAPASFLNGGDFSDIEIVDGVPSEYQSVMEYAICTAYSFPAPVFGASGMYLIQGFVATNPDVIPYGTLMYIASDRFTYGWAVAADCGTAMMEGYVDIDCFFETYQESVMFGKKLLNVYIVGQLTQAELEEYAANGMFYGRVPSSVEPAE